MLRRVYCAHDASRCGQWLLAATAATAASDGRFDGTSITGRFARAGIPLTASTAVWSACVAGLRMTSGVMVISVAALTIITPIIANMRHSTSYVVSRLHCLARPRGVFAKRGPLPPHSSPLHIAPGKEQLIGMAPPARRGHCRCSPYS